MMAMATPVPRRQIRCFFIVASSNRPVSFSHRASTSGRLEGLHDWAKFTSSRKAERREVNKNYSSVRKTLDIREWGLGSARHSPRRRRWNLLGLTFFEDPFKVFEGPLDLRY